MPPVVFLLIVTGVVTAFYARKSLMSLLARRYPTFHAEVVNLELSGLTPKRTFRLQRFIYSLYPEKTGDPDLMRLCNFLRIFTPLVIFLTAYVGVIVALRFIL